MNAGGEEFFQAKGFIDAARRRFQAQRLRMIDFGPSQVELGQEGIERVAILNLGIPSTIPGTDADLLNFLILQICQIGIRIQWPPWHFMYFRLIGVYGSILDSHQGIDGYQIVFTVMTVFAILGVLLSTYITHRIKTSHTLAK